MGREYSAMYQLKSVRSLGTAAFALHSTNISASSKLLLRLSSSMLCETCSCANSLTEKVCNVYDYVR